MYFLQVLHILVALHPHTILLLIQQGQVNSTAAQGKLNGVYNTEISDEATAHGADRKSLVINIAQLVHAVRAVAMVAAREADSWHGLQADGAFLGPADTAVLQPIAVSGLYAVGRGGCSSASAGAGGDGAVRRFPDRLRLGERIEVLRQPPPDCGRCDCLLRIHLAHPWCLWEQCWVRPQSKCTVQSTAVRIARGEFIRLWLDQS